MSKIKGKNTKPEALLFAALTLTGLKFKKHYKLLGNPDIVFPKIKLAIFVDGDFWHGFDYEKRKESLPEYWVKKISRNMERDKVYNESLTKEGWKVIRIWEHDILVNINKAKNKVVKAIENRKKLLMTNLQN